MKGRSLVVSVMKALKERLYLEKGKEDRKKEKGKRHVSKVKKKEE